jgi:hypothetical protein
MNPNTNITAPKEKVFEKVETERRVEGKTVDHKEHVLLDKTKQLGQHEIRGEDLYRNTGNAYPGYLAEHGVVPDKVIPGGYAADSYHVAGQGQPGLNRDINQGGLNQGLAGQPGLLNQGGLNQPGLNQGLNQGATFGTSGATTSSTFKQQDKRL